MSSALKETVVSFPSTPGVYIMKDVKGDVIYVGKAKDLRKRVSSYFLSRRDIKTSHLVGNIASIEYILTKTEYEALLLENNLIKQNLKKKLYTIYDYNILAETIVSGKNGRNVAQLVKAIENKNTVILKNYASAHNNDIRDRYVEPYAFTTNYVQIWCYCQDENKNKLFKVSRIGSVEIMPETWQNEADHRAGYIDIFRMNSEHTTTVKLKLNLRAANLLMEEYPLASKYLTKLSQNEWLLVTDVCSMDGVGRFVMGLLDDIEIVESPELQKYITFHLKNSRIPTNTVDQKLR